MMTYRYPVVRGNSDRAYRVQVLGTDSQWVETSDQVLPPCHHHDCTVVLCCPQAGERTGYYSYLRPGGGTVLVRYTAGRGGFRVLESRGVPGLATFGPAYSR